MGMVAVEIDNENKKKIGRIRLARVSDASSKSIDEFVGKNVERNSTVQTDGWNGYNNLDSNGFYRCVIRDTQNVGTDPMYHCHLITSLFKRWLLGTYQGVVRPEYVDYYLDEYTFRFNRRKSHSRGKLFFRLVEQAVAVDPVTRKDIEGGSPLPVY